MWLHLSAARHTGKSSTCDTTAKVLVYDYCCSRSAALGKSAALLLCISIMLLYLNCKCCSIIKWGHCSRWVLRFRGCVSIVVLLAAAATGRVVNLLPTCSRCSPVVIFIIHQCCIKCSTTLFYCYLIPQNRVHFCRQVIASGLCTERSPVEFTIQSSLRSG